MPGPDQQQDADEPKSARCRSSKWTIKKDAGNPGEVEEAKPNRTTTKRAQRHDPQELGEREYDVEMVRPW